MGYVSKEMIARAREIPAIDYILAHESGAFKSVGHGYRLRADNAFALSDKGWYCHRRNKGSKTALDYLVEIKGYGLVEAVCKILGENSLEASSFFKPKSKTKSN